MTRRIKCFETDVRRKRHTFENEIEKLLTTANGNGRLVVDPGGQLIVPEQIAPQVVDGGVHDLRREASEQVEEAIGARLVAQLQHADLGHADRQLRLDRTKTGVVRHGTETFGNTRKHASFCRTLSVTSGRSSMALSTVSTEASRRTLGVAHKSTTAEVKREKIADWLSCGVHGLHDSSSWPIHCSKSVLHGSQADTPPKTEQRSVRRLRMSDRLPLVGDVHP